MPTQTSINWLIKQAMNVQLTQKLITDLDNNPDPDADGQLGLLLVGKLYDDPTNTRLNVLIRNGAKDWEHSLIVADQSTAMSEMGVYEMGGDYGGTSFKRRYIIQLKLFFPGEQDQDTAVEISDLVLSRTENAVETMRDQFPIGPDSFGETAWRFEVNDSWSRESGGPGDFIGRGEVKLSVYTTKNILSVTS